MDKTHSTAQPYAFQVRWEENFTLAIDRGNASHCMRSMTANRLIESFSEIGALFERFLKRDVLGASS